MKHSREIAGLKNKIRSIPDFPKKGILFRDITTLLKDSKAFKKVINILGKQCQSKGIDVVVAVESRGFILGGALAYKIGAGFVPVRKKGKLPAETINATYDLEYGTDTLEIHKDAIKPGSKVIIIDDLLATGGTVSAVVKLVKELKGRVLSILFLIELVDLKGIEKIKEAPVYSLIKF